MPCRCLCRFRSFPHLCIALTVIISTLSTEAVHSFSMSSSSSTAVSASHGPLSAAANPSSTKTSSATNSASSQSGGDMRFSKFLIPSNSIFYRTRFSAAFVNLRPIVPGHVLVMPERIVAHLKDLSDEEYDDLWRSVRKVQKMLERQYKDCTAFNVAVQDGKAAGQSVPHVHVHILPRKGGDFERNDQVYDELEAWAPRECDVLAKKELSDKSDYLEVPDDVDRKDRTPEEMANEAARYRNIFADLEKEA